MIGKAWFNTLELITAQNLYEELVAMLEFSGFFLKIMPFVANLGYACDVAVAIIQWMKWLNRKAIYEFLIDPSVYPDIETYK